MTFSFVSEEKLHYLKNQEQFQQFSPIESNFILKTSIDSSSIHSLAVKVATQVRSVL